MKNRRCARCRIRIGRNFLVKRYERKRFRGIRYILCPRCYEDIKLVRSVGTLPVGDRMAEDGKHWWETSEKESNDI